MVNFPELLLFPPALFYPLPPLILALVGVIIGFPFEELIEPMYYGYGGSSALTLLMFPVLLNYSAIELGRFVELLRTALLASEEDEGLILLLLLLAIPN